MGTGSFLGVKRPGLGVDHPPSSSAEVKERVELYLYSPSGLSWPVLGWTSPLPFSPPIIRDRPIPLRHLVTIRVSHWKLWRSVIRESTVCRMVATYDACALRYSTKRIFCDPKQSAILQSYIWLAKPLLI